MMEGTYDVMLGTQKMGTVTVRGQGLYWQFSCRCPLSGEVMYHLTVQVGNSCEDLGILTPLDGQFGINTKLAMKRLEQGSPVFTLHAKRRGQSGLFVPVRPEEPFAYLHRLQEAYLFMQNQQMGILLPEEK